MYRVTKRVARQTAIWATLLAVTAFASSVHAAAFRTRWDPVFNTAFSTAVGIINVGWKGTALISVDDACVGTNQVISFVLSDSCNGLATLESFLLEFYDTGNSDAPLGDSGSIPFGNQVTQVSFDASSVADGFSLDGPIFAGVFSFNGSDGYAALLGFDLATGPQLTLERECEPNEPVENCVFSNDSDTYPTEITWERESQQVPVPASIWLLGLGVVLLGIQRRRQHS